MPAFDLSFLGEYALLLLIPGVVETAKEFGVSGKASLALSLILGMFFVGLAQAIAQGLVPEMALPWINIAVVGIGGALAASGYYDLFRKFTGNGG